MKFLLAVKDRYKPFWNVTLNVKRFQRSSENIARKKTANIYPQNNYLNFLTSKNIFITLEYSGDILGIFLKQIFVECCSNILETLLCDYWNLPKDQHLQVSNHTLLAQKQPFHRKLFKKSFPLKCSLNAPWMSRRLQHWGKTQRIFAEYCVPAEEYSS